MDNLAYPSCHPQVAMTISEGQAVIVLADSGQITVLNEAGTLIWDLCDGQHSIEQITERVCQEYEIDLATAQHDVHAFLGQMLELGAILLHNKPI